MKRSFLTKSLIISSFIFVMWSCNKDNTTPNRSWQLTWSDEFEGESGQLPDPTKWGMDVGTDWGNQQLEFDTDRPENISLDGTGNLRITARRESFQGSEFTSGRISTKGLFDQAYGRFEARMKIPYGPGIWPAFWLLGANIDEVNWPNCGEIDILEVRGHQPNLINAALHGPGYSSGEAVTNSFGIENSRFDSDFHIYAVEWGEDYVDFFVDDILYYQLAPSDLPGDWVYNHSFFIILNVAVGGSYVGFPTEKTPFPQTMLIDYVKVYKEN